MTTKMELDFYEKPGCINNTKQKKMLAEKGYVVLANNILTTKWNKEELLKFISERPVHECFNNSAPRIKSGEVQVEKYTTHEAAVDEMIKDPYLIKRPLIKYGERYGCGFDSRLANDLIEGINVESLLTCPQMAKKKQCDD